MNVPSYLTSLIAAKQGPSRTLPPPPRPASVLDEPDLQSLLPAAEVKQTKGADLGGWAAKIGSAASLIGMAAPLAALIPGAAPAMPVMQGIGMAAMPITAAAPAISGVEQLFA